MSAMRHRSRPHRLPSARSVQYVAERVAPRWLLGDPACGAYGTLREEIAAGRAVGELESFAGAEQMCGVVADDVAAAKGEHADLVLGARAHDAVAARDGA